MRWRPTNLPRLQRVGSLLARAIARAYGLLQALVVHIVHVWLRARLPRLVRWAPCRPLAYGCVLWHVAVAGAEPVLDMTCCDSIALQITVLFADVVGFTPMCREVPPQTVMAFLNDLFSRFDELTVIYNVYKVETIGGGCCQMHRAVPHCTALHRSSAVCMGRALCIQLSLHVPCACNPCCMHCSGLGDGLSV